MNPKVDFYFNKSNKWQQEIKQLRTIVLDCGLTEELKWGVPCYTFPSSTQQRASKESNIVLIHVFKEYCALLFFKGALLNDADKVLIQQTENVQSGRQVRFTNLQQVINMEALLKAYIFEAIEIEKAGLKLEPGKMTTMKMPEEFKQKLAGDTALEIAFLKLTPGRQRAYNLYFSAAKQAKTRENRIEKCLSQILAGKGLED